LHLKKFINGFATLKPSYTRQMQPNLMYRNFKLLFLPLACPERSRRDGGG